jgi:uncharacterized protein involved in outer membrane biogenesis
MHAHRASTWERIPRHARRTGIAVAAILVGWLLCLWLYGWGILAGPTAALASKVLHRRVQIGQFNAQLLRWAPTITINGLTVANASWAQGPYLARIRSITIGIEPWKLLRGHLALSQLEIDDPDISLQRDGQGRENWDFGQSPQQKPPPGQPPKATTPPPKLPPVNLFTMRGGSLRMTDEVRHLQFDGSVVANEHAAHPEREPLRVQGHGQLNDKPFTLVFNGGALFDIHLDQPYNLDTTITAGPLSVFVQGEVDRPFDFSHFGANLQVKGQNLAGLYYLTGIALPFTPPFSFGAQVRNDAEIFTLRNIRATVGQSDVAGNMRVDDSGVRPLLSADLHSHSMRLSDLAPSIGAGVPPNESQQADLQAPSANKTAYGPLPTYRFDFSRLRKTDARVTLQADSVKGNMPIRGFQLNLQLNNGELSLDPLQVTLPTGLIRGVLRIDAHGTKGVTALDMRLRDIDLAQFKPAKMPQPPIEGTLEARLQLKGEGSSVHDILASSNGAFTAVIPKGEIRKAFAELTGINVAKGLGLLLSGNQQETPIQCSIAAFAVKDGVAQVQQLVLATGTVQVTGTGNINFGNEKLDLTIQGHPKHLSLFHLYAPIVVDGTFSKPGFGVKPGGLIAQAGAAVALGVLATPAAAVLAFVDPGLTKDADCTALLSNPRARSTEHPGPPHASPKAPAPKAAPLPRHVPTQPRGAPGG